MAKEDIFIAISSLAILAGLLAAAPGIPSATLLLCRVPAALVASSFVGRAIRACCAVIRAGRLA